MYTESRRFNSIFPGFAERDIRPALLGQVQVDLARRDVYEAVTVIQRQVIVRFLLKILQHSFVVDVYPARRCHIDRFELAIDPIFVLQAMGDYIEL